MSKQKKRKNPLLWLIPLTILLIAALVMTIIIPERLEEDKRRELDEKISAAIAQNDEIYAEYQANLADFEAEHSNDTANQAWPAPQTTEGWQIMDLTSYPVAGSGTATISRADAMMGGMLLINQWHSRPQDYDESSLVSVGSTAKGKVQVANYNIKLHPIAIDALVAAVADAKAEGLTHYMVSEGYRSYDDQNTLFQNVINKMKTKSQYKGYSDEQLVEAAKEQVNFPGTSEFNSGLSFTLRLYDKEDASVGSGHYSTTDAAIWMNTNCWRYGLIFRFPNEDFPLPGTIDKSFKTGVSSKLNLYRYVGKGNAAVMHINDLCLQEYLDYLAEHSHIAVFEDGQLRYEIARSYVGDSLNIQVTTMSKAANTQYSLDNMGYLITVYEY